MEGRRSRSKPAEVEPVNAHASPVPTKSTAKGSATHASPPQGKSAAKAAVTHVDTVKNAVDDRCVPTVGGENKRKRAPRGPGGRNLKAKVESVNEDEAKVDSAPAADDEGSGSHSRGFRESQGALRKEEDKSGTENDESQEGGVNSKEQVEKRRGSSRLRIRPSKFRESLPVSSSKVKGESKSSEDNSLKSVEVVLSLNTPTPTGKPKDDDQLVQLVPSQVGTRELISRIFSRRKENKSKSAAVKDKGPSTSAPVVPTSSDTIGLKAVLLALKRIMKMKEAEPFNKPVDPVKLGIPDYLEVVKMPMDLGTIRDRLEKGEVYNTVDDVFEDVVLVWSNCRKYNDDGDPIMGLLQNLESTFDKLCLAAGFPFHATDAAEANSDKPKGEGLQQQENVQVKVSKKKKAKVAQPDALKTKIKRSAPVDQVMAESKAREQKDNAEELNVGDLDRDVKNAVESSSGADKQVETPQADQQGSEDEEMHDADQEPSLQGPVETPSMKEEESAPTRPHRKSTNSQLVNVPAKIKRPNGHSTLTHRQGCLCVVCVGRRKREAKLRKSSGAHSKVHKSAKKKSGGPNSSDMAAEEEEDFTFAEDGEDALNGSDNVQGYTSNKYQLPLRKLDPYVVKMSSILLGSKPGSIWNRPRSLGYVPVPLPGRSVGIADAVSFLSH